MTSYETTQYDPAQPADYDPHPVPGTPNRPVFQNEFVAWRVLLAPQEYPTQFLTDLFKRGMETYKGTDDIFQDEPFIYDVEQLALAATDDPAHDDIVSTPWVSLRQPGRLALLCMAAANGLKHSPAHDLPPSRIEYEQYAEEVLWAHIDAAMHHHPRDFGIQQELAELVFGRRQQDKRGPPPGRVVTDFCRPFTDDGDDSAYIEMPLIHASRHALCRDGPDGEIKSVVRDNNVYIPHYLLWDRAEQYVLGGGTRTPLATRLRTAYWDITPERTQTTFLQEISRINDQIERLIETGRTRNLYADRRYEPPLEALLYAVDEAPNEVSAIGSWNLASEVVEAIEWVQDRPPADAESLDTEGASRQLSRLTSYHKHQLAQFDSVQSVSTFLRQHTEHPDVEYREKAHPHPDQFLLQLKQFDVTQLNVTEPADVFELPCLSNLEEYFMQNPPERRPLYFMVRIIASLNNDFTAEEIAQVFERFPWYDEQVTHYQVNYELRQDKEQDGPVLPVSCHNDNNPSWSQFCIGLENCEYSIYGSLDFKQEVYDAIDSTE
jgi:hypothetical protein